MDIRFSRFAFALLLAAAPAAADPCAAVDWAKVSWAPAYAKDGVQVWRKVIPACPLIAFRGSGSIDAPIAKVLAVVLDPSRESLWIDGLREARVLRAVSPGEDYEYNRIASGFFLIEDRDLVVHNVVTFDRAGRRVEVDSSSSDEPDVPRSSGVVRARLEHSSMLIAAKDGGRKASFTIDALLDPRGRVPKWVMNLFQERFPVQTILKIRAAVESR